MTYSPPLDVDQPRRTDGRWGPKVHTAPSSALHPPVNLFADRWDTHPGRRPLRPYLPLQQTDRAAVEHAPPGTQITVAPSSGRGNATLRLEGRTGAWAVLGGGGPPLPVRSVWAALHSQDGQLHSTMLTPPMGMLFSDQRGYVFRGHVDRVITVDEAIGQLHGRRVHLVSEVVEGHYQGVPDTFDEDITVHIDRRTRYARFHSSRPRVKPRTQFLTGKHAADRDGDIVLSHQAGTGYVEHVYRVVG